MTTITALPTPPTREDPTNFASRADDFLAALPTFVTETNTLAGELTTAADAAILAETNSEISAATAVGAANYKGAWSSLVGALNIPASVTHNGKIWLLLNNLANVASSQPGVSADWRDITPYEAPSGSLGFRNKIINGNFTINQDAVSGTVVLTAGQYGHDQWKAGASGCTYTFSSSGGVTTLTITAGSLIQPIEGVNLQTGTYVLTWTGTAQGKIGAGSYGASGQTASVTGNIDLNIEFGTGTLSLVQFELGTKATPFEHRSIQLEEILCYRYYFNDPNYNVVLEGFTSSGWQFKSCTHYHVVEMRTTPTVTSTNANGGTLTFTHSKRAIRITTSTATANVLSSVTALKLNARL